MSVKRKRSDDDAAASAANTLYSLGKTMPAEEHAGAVEGLTAIYSQLEAKGYLPNTKAKRAFDALLTNGTFKEGKINESLGSLPNLPDLSEIAGGRKQRGGKDCNYAILMAMMAVLYWTGVVPAAATAVYSTVATQIVNGTSYVPTIDTIMDYMGRCMTYFSTFIPSAFPGEDLAYAFGSVANTFVRKVGEMLIILAEAANLSLKMGFSMGAKTIWDTTISWVKDNPTYVIAGYTAKTALGWRNELKAIKDKETAPVALTQEQKNKYKDLFFDLVVRIRDLLCDLTDVIRNTTTDAAAKIKEMSTVGKTTATTTATAATNTDPDPIEEIREDLSLLKGLADAAAAAEPLASGGKRSTRKRNSRTRKPKTRNVKKRKSSGRKAKKASRKIKSRKGRKTRRRGSKKR